VTSRHVPALLVLLILASAQSTSAGGRGGLFVRGTFSGSSAAVAGGAVAGAAMTFGAAATANGWDAPPGDSTFLIVDASPPTADVFLDGRRLGGAGELMARALSVSYGRHAVQVVAPGFRPWLARFVVDGNFPVWLRPTLSPEPAAGRR
jgi:PEGA domain-containing protein